jgi:hypothetical protein
VLAEPGMGKSELIRELGRRLGVEPVSAVRFMLSKDPLRFVRSDVPLLIDGLDEAMARREGDAVDTVLAQLEEAGSPTFILTCRSREWQARSETNLRQLYGTDPAVFSLEPLSRDEATAFLEQRHPRADVSNVLDHLDMHKLRDLYRNPLTLGLMGRVAESDSQLPSSRAALFERVCVLIWPEHDRDRQDERLAQLTEHEALEAAGAISAALLFAGAEAVSIAGKAQVQEGDLQLTALAALPCAGAVRAIFSSNLFVGLGTSRAKPIHRVIAEFLAARWLAARATSPRAQRRLLAQFHGSGAVPASLRGVHAWLAYHSASMAERVIAADPYGVLRYGETTSLNPSQADRLFQAMEALAEDDPYFRASDWDNVTAGGLMIDAMRGKIDSVVASAASNSHLRSLLIEGLNGTPLASALAPTLEAVLLSEDRFYSEREDAAEALLPHREADWWRVAIASLREQGTEDATRLARNLIEMIGCAVPNALLVETIFAEMGLTVDPLSQPKKGRRHTARNYNRIITAIGVERLPEVLDLITDYSTLVPRGDWANEGDVADLAARLILRAIDESAVGPAEAPALWRWLGIIEHATRYRRDSKRDVATALAEHVALRRAVQLHALYVDRRGVSLWRAEVDLQRRLVGLSMRVGDAGWLLERLEDADNKDKALRDDWCDLLRIAHHHDGYEPGALESAKRFARGDRQLLAFARRLENPKKPAWQVKQEREAAKRARKERVRKEEDRRWFAAHKSALRAGDLNQIVPTAKTYLGFAGRGNRELPAAERLVEWLGPELADDALAGLDAVLHRSDLPSIAQITVGFAGGTIYNFCFAIMAGLLARRRRGQGFTDLSAEVRLTGLLLCYNDRGWCSDDDLSELRDALEALVLSTPEARIAFARLWVEPSLATGRSHVTGLYMLANGEAWQSTGGALADEWLLRFPDVPDSVEAVLVDCLTHSGELSKLEAVAEERSTSVFRSFDHMLAWLAIDVLVRFEKVRRDLDGIGARHPNFIWFLRNRLQLERRGEMLPLSITQAEWIWTEFRAQWPHATLEGSGSGNTNDYDATDFLRALLARIANDSSVEAGEALQALIAGPEDSYSELIRHMAAEQRQKRAEEDFSPLTPTGLGELLADGPPSNADDLKALVIEELTIAQAKLVGEDIDEVRDFWTDAGIPRDENRCRDRLAAMIGPELMRYDIQRITEADMPMTKRADLAFARGPMQMPMEVKGQWHKEVWDAAAGQLDLQYLIDWRSDQRGIYCVLWFGNVPSKTGRRLKAHPGWIDAPKTAEEMRTMLIARIPEARRSLIAVVVLDLTAGRPGP